MLYFTSDLHFNHENIIKHAKRSFSTVEKMNQVLIRNWNRTVKAEDDIYILGDLTMKGASVAMEMISQLKGKKYLICGNHDRFVRQPDFEPSLFEWVKDYEEINYHTTKFILFHYPIQEWNGFFRGSIHLHGHQHNWEDYNLRNRD